MVIMLTFVLFMASHVDTEAATSDNYIKIGLKYGSSAVTTCTVKSDNGFILGVADNRSFVEGMPLPGYTTLVASYENGNVVLRDENGTTLSADLGSSGCIMPLDYKSGGILYLENVPYRDGIMLPAKSNNTLTVINYLTIEHYVYGVLNSELGYSNPEEALKAQAVAARSYAELNLGKHSADGFDLCASTHCQVYKGYSEEYKATNEATDETSGEMIYYGGKPVTAFYYKNSGGYTQNAEDVWTYSFPYLKSVKDEYCPSYPWSTSLSFDSIRSKLEAAGYNPGSIQSVSISNSNSTGAVAELKITGSNTAVCLTKEKIRNVLGATIIKSNMFTLSNGDTATGSSSWKISNGFDLVSPGSKIYVVNGSGNVKQFADGDPFYGHNGTSTASLGNNGSQAATVTGGTVNFSGYGYGHGVGMPQDSAIEMAKKGFTYNEILKYYYTGIEIK
jgi:stage II sporulation protein D